MRVIEGRLGAVLLVTGGLMCAGPTAAQEAPASDSRIETVVVTGSLLTTHSATGTKTDTPIIETPQSISVINRNQLTLQNPQDISQAIGYSAGVTPSQFGFDPRFPQFQIRGFSEFYNGVFQDGTRLFASDFIGPLLEPYGLEQIDILRGPTSVLYGQNAPGGLVNLTSKRPQDNAFGELQLQVGNFDRYDGRWDLNAPLTDDGSVLARLTGVYRESGTQYVNIPDDETYVAPALTWKPRDGTTLTILASYQRVSGGESELAFLPAILPPGYPQSIYRYDPQFNTSTQQTFAIGYQFDQVLGDGWNLHQSFRYTDSRANLEAVNPIDFDSATTLSMQAEHLTNTLDAVTLDTNVTGKIETGPVQHTLIFGVDYQNNPFSALDLVGDAPDLDYFNPTYNVKITPPTTVSSSVHQGAGEVGIYAQDQMAFDNHWFLTGGLRQDWASLRTRNYVGDFFTNAPAEQDNSALTGRVGLVYISDIGLAPYVSYSTSFVPQSGTDFFGKPFNPLTGQQYEAGIRYLPKGGWISATLSIYDLTEQHVLSADPDNTHNGFQIETGEERSRGIEFETVLTPYSGLNVTGAYTYDDVRITQSTLPYEIDRQPANTPPTQVSVFGDYTFQGGTLQGLGLGGGMRYASAAYTDTTNAIRTGSLTFFDADAHYEIEDWRLALNVTNLTDADPQLCFGIVCHFSRARTIIGSITRRF
jgi:iron complex outermembrane receptor protein